MQSYQNYRNWSKGPKKYWFGWLKLCSGWEQDRTEQTEWTSPSLARVWKGAVGAFSYPGTLNTHEHFKAVEGKSSGGGTWRWSKNSATVRSARVDPPAVTTTVKIPETESTSLALANMLNLTHICNLKHKQLKLQKSEEQINHNAPKDPFKPRLHCQLPSLCCQAPLLSLRSAWCQTSPSPLLSVCKDIVWINYVWNRTCHLKVWRTNYFSPWNPFLQISGTYWHK